MQIRCANCTRTIAIAPDGALPDDCPHCSNRPLPERLGDYRLERLLAAGGMGEVYLAHHSEFGTGVAIKLLPAVPHDQHAAVRERFAREARLTARVEHPGVVQVLDADAFGDRPFLVLELVHGQTLRQWIAHSPPSPSEAARLVAATADVVAAAHARGVLHRDIKPDNVMLQPDGQVRVLDFGLARAISENEPLTRTGEILGTPEYMAPEQLLDGPEAIDERTDVHALGLLLYELLSGRSPYRGSNLFQSLKLVESLAPPPPHRRDNREPHVCAALEPVVERALAKRRDDRFASAAAFAAAVRAAAPDAADATRTRRPRRIVALLAAGLLATTLLLVSQSTGALADGADRNTPGTASRDVAQVLAEMDEHLRAGRFQRVLRDAHQLRQEPTLGPPSHERAQRAFAYAHYAWLIAAHLPAWLGVSDIGTRQRLFGDLLEPDGDALSEEMRLLLGDAAAWRVHLSNLEDDTACARLLQVAALEAEPRAAAMHALARTLPLDEPERWLAMTITHHLRGERAQALQAAELAWLHGAGELAVLIDTALALPTASDAARVRLWRRVAGADQQDCPASTLLLLHLEAIGVARIGFEPTAARTFPATHRAAAARWFVQRARAHAPSERPTIDLLRIAIALGHTPDFTTAPWRSVPTNARALLEQEVRSGG